MASICYASWKSYSACTRSSYIYFSEDVRATRIDIPVYIGSVPTEHLEAFPAKLKDSLQCIADEGIDMERMRVVINRDERQVRPHAV